MRAVHLGLRLVGVLLLSFLTLPATSSVQTIPGDTWYRAGLVRRAVEPPYRTQLDDSIYARSDCGPAVLGMVLTDYGIDADTMELRQSPDRLRAAAYLNAFLAAA